MKIYIFIFELCQKKRRARIPALLEYFKYKFVIYDLAESPISSTRALTDFLGSVDISIL